MKPTLAVLVVAVTFALAVGCSSSKLAPPALAEGNVVNLTVTSKGFEPTPVRVKAGQPVKLVITRTSDDTCATDIVVKDYAVKEPLPLNRAVTVSFTPTKTGELKYGCAMDQMVSGVLLVE